MKERGEEPTYPALVANNQKQLLNPETGEVVGKKRVYAILEERCFDDPTNPEDTWVNRARLSKTALTDDAKPAAKKKEGPISRKFRKGIALKIDQSTLFFNSFTFLKLLS